MVAVRAELPDDPRERDAIEALLQAQPELRIIIDKAQQKVEDLFPNPTYHLDTKQYDDWDPPIRMLIHTWMPENESESAYRSFLRWKAHDDDYDSDKIFILSLRLRGWRA